MPHATNSRTPAPIWVHEPIITPELKVWRAVLEQAYQDAELSGYPEADSAESSECTKARRYLRADSLHEVTQVAGVASIVAGVVLSLHHWPVAAALIGGGVVFYIGKKLRAQ